MPISCGLTGIQRLRWDRGVLARLKEARSTQGIILERQNTADTEHETAVVFEAYVEQVLRRRGYNTEKQRIQFPADTMTLWSNAAIGETATAISVGMRLRQMSNEGRLKRIRKSESKRKRRFYEWVGESATAATKPFDFSPKGPPKP